MILSTFWPKIGDHALACLLGETMHLLGAKLLGEDPADLGVVKTNIRNG